MNIAQLHDVSKIYCIDDEYDTYALNHVDLGIEQGKFQAVIGASGSGKSTLLNVLGGLDRVSEGEVVFNLQDENKTQVDITDMTNDDLIDFRRKHIGFIFQNYNLVPMMTVLENIIFPLQLDEQEIDFDFIDTIMEKLDISGQKNKYPNQLSGGQQQRVSIARALVMKPDVILADEPTGNLDQKNSRYVVELLKNSAKLYNQTIVMVTHDKEIAGICDRRIYIEDGQVVRDEWN